MHWKDGSRLRPGMRSFPVLDSTSVEIDGITVPSEEDLRKLFPTNAQRLQTWGRLSGLKNGTDPHWIGGYKETDMHTDPGYPRYTHHLVLRSDPGIVLRGLDDRSLPISPGTVHVLDTHSPHQLHATDPEARWYVAVSIDSKGPFTIESVIPPLLAYARQNPVLTPDTADMI